ncbi:hypothetical protein E5Q_00600 [Mixia osmundae IAM 14324]|uniref:Uncharacterized protein n=1 Tax=Mixia osmundae (strain CBS 9802 / IAM 14324 / JCM 22182 / KY 12970) TaxID=764103 RepID=G7DT75_MIXOS|nr:hypothetical protein E5Q_00600 [Mixia osmundae IAM 14324]
MSAMPAWQRQRLRAPSPRERRFVREQAERLQQTRLTANANRLASKGRA